MAELGGRWAVAAIPGVGIRRVFIASAAVDPGRESAREISRTQEAVLAYSFGEADRSSEPWADEPAVRVPRTPTTHK